MHETLKMKWVAMAARYEKVSAFAEMLPMFEKQIIAQELVPDAYCQLGVRHGKLYCAWGINWYTNTPTNYPKEAHSQVGFVNVYINAFALFPESCYAFAQAELGKVLPAIKVHFYDPLNTTFYFLPDEAAEGLAKLEAWFVETHAQCDAYLKRQRMAELERELQALKA